MLSLKLSPDFAESIQLAAAGCLVTLWLLWRTKQLYESFGRNQKPRNVITCQEPTWLGNWVSGVRYLRNAPDILLANYVSAAFREINGLNINSMIDNSVKNSGIPYAVPTPETYYVHVSSEAQVRELSEASEAHLSLHAWAKDVLQPTYTMGGLEVKDRMSDNGTLHTRVLRVVLRSHLLTLRPMLEQTISETFEDEYASGKILGDGWRSIHSFSMAKNLIRTVNSFVYFGKHLSSDHGFLEAAMQYPDDVFYTSEVLRFLPSFLAPIAAPILMRQGRAAKTLIRYLHSVIEERLMNQSSANPQTKSLDCIQWIIDTNSRKNNWSTERVIQVVIGLWYASVHQLAISVVYGLVDLCEHAEYLEPLREEVEKHRHLDYVDEDLERMPRLDSFLKESARLHPSDSISIRRKAVQPYVFRDGTHVTAGDVVCVPLRAIMCDEKNFPNAMTFDGFRFMTEDGTGVTSKLTDESARFPLWGLGRRSCPGRYYASHVLKLIFAHILQNYDFKMAAPDKGHGRFHWRSATVPKSSATLLFRKRVG